jgi:hypothetical protein
MSATSTSLRFRSVLLLSTAALLAVGGCGGDNEIMTSILKSRVSALNLAKTVYSTGESIALGALPSAATAASLTFSDGQKFAIPILPDGSVMVPVLTAALAAQTVKLSVTTARGEFRSQDIHLQPIAITTSKPGIATLIYLDATLANVGAAIDELVTLSGDPQTTDTAELQEIKSSLEQLRGAIVQAQSGTPYELSTSSDTSKLYIDTQQLEIFDQYVMAMLQTTARSPATAAAIVRANYSAPTGALSDLRTAQAAGLSIQLAPTAGFASGSLDCSGLADQADRAWCANMRTQIANDIIINYAGMVGVVGGTAAAALGALAAIGVAGVAFPAAVIGTVALGTVVVANMVAGAVQGASAYGTGTSQGTNVRDNITNLVNAARGYVTGSIAKALPNGGSDLIKAINKTVTKIVAPALFTAYDKLVDKYTKLVSGCSAQAVSGGQGSFANRYDFGSARALRLSYDAFTVPDQFSVFDGSGSLGGTGGLVSGTGTLSFTTTGRFVTVKVNAPTSGTAWNYSIFCAN